MRIRLLADSTILLLLLAMLGWHAATQSLSAEAEHTTREAEPRRSEARSSLKIPEAMNPLLPLTLTMAFFVSVGVSPQEEERAQRLEDARAAVEARLTRSTLRNVRVTASEVKRVRRITIAVAPFNKNARDDASSALTAAWQPALRHLKSFDEIAVLVGPRYWVTCSARALADTTISLWGERLTRTCREQRTEGK